MNKFGIYEIDNNRVITNFIDDEIKILRSSLNLSNNSEEKVFCMKDFIANNKSASNKISMHSIGGTTALIANAVKTIPDIVKMRNIMYSIRRDTEAIKQGERESDNDASHQKTPADRRRISRIANLREEIKQHYKQLAEYKDRTYQRAAVKPKPVAADRKIKPAMPNYAEADFWALIDEAKWHNTPNIEMFTRWCLIVKARPAIFRDNFAEFLERKIQDLPMDFDVPLGLRNFKFHIVLLGRAAYEGYKHDPDSSLQLLAQENMYINLGANQKNKNADLDVDSDEDE
jgi:hypothetical protein